MNSWYHIFTSSLFLFFSSLFSWGAILTLLRSPFVDYFTDRPDPRKVHSLPIPRLGGIVIVGTFLLFLSIAYMFNNNLHLLSGISLKTLGVLVFFSIVLLFLGVFDDTSFKTVRVRHKVAVELLVAFITVYILDINIGTLSLFGLVTFPPWFSNIISFLWIFGLSNAFNLIDGLDGLAGSISLIALSTLAVIAGIGGHFSIVVICCIAAGALVGFLIHNMPPAKTFMGDTGSLFLGTLIAILALYVGREVTQERSFLVMPLIAGIPIIEVFTTMVRRYFKAKDEQANLARRIHSMVIPDNSHIHHRFISRGYSASQAVILMSLLSFTLSCGAFCCVFLPPTAIPFLLFYLLVPVVFTLYQLGYGGRFKKALRLSSSRYNGFRKPSLVGVIDHQGAITQLLSNRKSPAINYIHITEEQIPSLSPHLHSAIVDGTFEKEKTIQKAEKISSVLSRPVFIIEHNDRVNLFIRKVSRNGSLVVTEKNVSLRELIKDIESISASGKIRHPEPPASSHLENIPDFAAC